MQSCDWWVDHSAVQPGTSAILLHQVEPPMQLLPIYSSHGDRQGGRVSTTSPPFSFPMCTGGKGAMKQLETLLTFRIPILSAQNRLKTGNLVSISASYQISWFFQGSFGTDSRFVGNPWCKDRSPATLRKLSPWFQPQQRNNPISGKYKERQREEQKPTFLSSSQVAAFNGVSSVVVKAGQEAPT